MSKLYSVSIFDAIIGKMSNEPCIAIVFTYIIRGSWKIFSLINVDTRNHALGYSKITSLEL